MGSRSKPRAAGVVAPGRVFSYRKGPHEVTFTRAVESVLRDGRQWAAAFAATSPDIAAALRNHRRHAPQRVESVAETVERELRHDLPSWARAEVAAGWVRA